MTRNSENNHTAVELPPLRQLLTVAQVGQLLNLSRSQVYTLLSEGRLNSLKIGRSRRVPALAVDDFLDGLLDASQSV